MVQRDWIVAARRFHDVVEGIGHGWPKLTGIPVAMRSTSMLKSLLVLLNDARKAYQASDLARNWASSRDALCAGLSILDVETLCGNEPVPMAGMSAKEQRDQKLLDEARAQLEHVRDQFRSLCAQSHVASQLLDEEGRPADVIAREAQRCDLVLVDCPQERSVLGGLSSDQLIGVVKHCPRPLVVVPERPAEPTDVVIAYDGSLQAARAVQAFAQSGLASDRPVRVVGVAEHYVTVTRRVDRAVEFLSRHNIAATAVPMVSDEDPATVILNHVAAFPTGLLVMGTFGQGVLREVLLGSVTRRVLRYCPVPVFLYH
jgi:nucleotide-binding universal stress UspA family protein